LCKAPHNLRLAFISLDELYLTHEELNALRTANPSNTLLHGRGLPGTHDLQLGYNVLSALKNINTDDSPATVQLPIYDKSKHSGLGDRIQETREVQGPLDIVIFEGWMLGFCNLTGHEIEEAYQSHSVPNAAAVPLRPPLGNKLLNGPFFTHHSLEDLQTINQLLKSYVDRLWPFVDCFIQMTPEDMGFTWEWRLQQEHNMKAKNGGVGMSDEQVEGFVTRYMPGYELFGYGIQRTDSPWAGKGLQIRVNNLRQVVDVSQF